MHFRDHSHEHLNKLIDSMNAFQLEFDTVIRYKNVNYQSDWFIERLWELYNQNCPKRSKTVSYKYYLKRWLNEEIKCQINRKHVLFKNYKRRLIPFDVFNSKKKHVTKIIRQSKQKCYATQFKRVRDSIKDTWKTINSVFHRKKSGSDRIVLRDNDGGEINNPTEVSNMFGYYFSNVAVNLDMSIPLSQADPMSYMPPLVNSSFFAFPTTPTEVQKIIKSLPNKSCNINTVPVFIYKKLSLYLSPIICNIFNTSV